MKTDNIIKLLRSENHDDILLGLNFLTKENFEEVYKELREYRGIKYQDRTCFYFIRDEKVYFFIKGSYIHSSSSTSMNDTGLMIQDRIITDIIV